MTRRSRAREVALQVLFQDDLNPRPNPAEGDALIARRLRTSALIEFCRDLVAGVRRNRDQLDQRIENTATNWSLHRMAATDRNVLRLGAFELLFTMTPGRVVVNEAVELAKRYGSAQSAQFVNGILDRLFHAQTPATGSASANGGAVDADANAEVNTNAEIGG
jgi:N utilization substance protein B